MEGRRGGGGGEEGGEGGGGSEGGGERGAGRVGCDKALSRQRTQSKVPLIELCRGGERRKRQT